MIDDKYEDIINLEYKKSSYRTPMSIENRSAQFAPFSALTGYGEAINETSRLTNRKIDIDEGLNEFLNRKLSILKDFIKNKPLVSITYFVKDKTKKGGEYISITDNLDKIKEVEGFLQLKNKAKIEFKDILNIECNDIKLNDEFYE
ncbi:MAG: hypothetical protein J6B98_04405 [Bacilli bacterium]|nr:hypothetical protein [Bacilli bacterium]